MTSFEEKRERLRFESLEQDDFPDGRFRARVVLEWTGGVRFEGTSEGTSTLEGKLRAGARATLQAASRAAGKKVSLSLRGVKAIRAFDAWLVVVSVRGKSDEETYRLIGAYPCPDDDTVSGAAMAVLDATNRVLSRFFEASRAVPEGHGHPGGNKCGQRLQSRELKPAEPPTPCRPPGSPGIPRRRPPPGE